MIDSLLVLSGVRFNDRVRERCATCDHLPRTGGVYRQKPRQQHLHLAVEHHLRGRRRVHLFWTQPEREGQESQCHLPPHRGGRV